MNLDLIPQCYENPYNLNLREFHIRNCRIDNNEQYLIDTINNGERISFYDGISKNFKLVIYNDLVYLIGESSCYPCSHVIESNMGKEFNWVSCYFVPKGEKLLGETDVRKSAIIISFYNELIPLIKNEKTFTLFLSNISLSLSSCEWFEKIKSLSLFIRLSTFWDYKEKLSRLYENGLLYPFELALFNLYKGNHFQTRLYINYFLDSLAESTKKITNKVEISKFLNDLSSRELETIFEIEEIRENVDYHILSEEYLADLLELDCEKRHPFNNSLSFGLLKSREKVKELIPVPTFRKDYLRLLKHNFRLLENNLRKQKGFEGVGSFYMEKLLYEKLKELYPDLNIQTQYSPSWLWPQRFDIFIKDFNLAIEYNGAQHYIAIDFFGGKNGLKKNQERDLIKRQKCLDNSILLWEIRHDEDFDLALKKLKEHIQSIDEK